MKPKNLHAESQHILLDLAWSRTYIHYVWGWKRFLLPVKYFLTNLLYPFTLLLRHRSLQKWWVALRSGIALAN